MVQTRWRVTARDLELLGWIGRWRFVATDQIVRRYGTGIDATRAVNRRLQALREVGLLDSARIVTMTPTLHWLTVEGLRTVGAAGVSKPPRVAEIMHDYEVVELATWLERKHPELAIHTEREVRSWEAPNRHLIPEPKYSLRTVRPGGSPGRLYPDLVSVGRDGQVWGHEYEASVKEHGRLVRLMLTYAAVSTHRGAVYYVTPATAGAVKRAADDANRIAQERGQGRPIAVSDWPIQQERGQ